MNIRSFIAAAITLVITGCNSGSDGGPEPESRIIEQDTRGEQLKTLIVQTNQAGLQAYVLPLETDFAAIPQDPKNPITAAKVELGKLLFHETGLAQSGNNPGLVGTWSCASCHHAAAGFKAGVPQGIGEGGVGFGMRGEARRLEATMDAGAPDDSASKPDIQPVATPTVLNTAFQPVMLWNGQFGNAEAGSVNDDIDPARLLTPDTPKTANTRKLHGLETQAIAGLGVHRLDVGTDSAVQTDATYQALFRAAFPDGSDDILRDAGFAIAAYERTILATQAPFQRWLRGEEGALDEQAMDGALLFFGRAGCVACHQGPALSSSLNASEDEMFFSIGFADLNLSDPRVHGAIGEADRRGRGGLTGKAGDEYRFKIPQLYNLADSHMFGHGASFNSIRATIQYKNAALPQNPTARANMDPRFKPLGLSESEIDDLVEFLGTALRDPDLARYVPPSVPSGRCFPVADGPALADLGCSDSARMRGSAENNALNTSQSRAPERVKPQNE